MNISGIKKNPSMDFTVFYYFLCRENLRLPKALTRNKKRYKKWINGKI